MIQTRGLTKDFWSAGARPCTPCAGIDLDVAPGELVAVLGPNGAGKTTTLRMLTTLSRRPRARRRSPAHDIVADPARCAGTSATSARATAPATPSASRDELVSQGRIYGLDRARRPAAGRRAARGARPRRPRRPQGQRACPAASGGGSTWRIGLVHAPPLLFLDEPSTGLDPQNRANLWEHILRLRAEHGMTIVLTTHYLDEADTMAERVVVIDHGAGHRRRHRRARSRRSSPATGSMLDRRPAARRVVGGAASRGCPAPGR